MDQIDPRLIEIEILADADRAFVSRAAGSFQYSKVNASGGVDTQRNEALFGLISDRAIVGGTHYQGRAGGTVSHYPPTVADIPNPSHAIDAAAEQAIKEFLGTSSILNLRITQIGRLRLFRLRDEILQRDHIRDVAGIWVKQHFLPDLAVRLRLRDLEKPVSLIVIDVDNLKKVNDELGHHGADSVLEGIFETLRDVVQPHYAYRLGGDEAGAMLPGVSLDTAAKLGEEIRATIERRVWEGLKIQTKPTVSVGVGTYVSPKLIEAGDLYAAVDALADRAKKAGKNRVVSANVPEPSK